MRVVFLGGVKMGYDCLVEMQKQKNEVAAIFCLPQTASSRSGYVDFTPLAKKYRIPIFKYEDINCLEAVENMKKAAPDLIVVVGWSGIIGNEILAIPKKGVLGHHPTLLPKHRGNAPIPWTLINGLASSGVTFFFLEKEIDRGDIAGQEEFDVTLQDDAPSLYDKATQATASLLLEILPKIENGTLRPIKQDATRASRWPRRKPEDGIIDWNCMALYIYNWVRGLTHPYPGAFTFMGDRKIFIWKAKMAQEGKTGRPGEILKADGRLVVKSGDGAIELESVQLEGEKEISGAAFAAKHRLKTGTILG